MFMELGIIRLLILLAIIFFFIIYFIFTLEDKKLISYCREKGFTVLDKNKAKSFFPKGFSIWDKQQLAIVKRGMSWDAWVDLNQHAREMYFFSLSHNGGGSGGSEYNSASYHANPKVIGIATKININIPYTKIASIHSDVYNTHHRFMDRPAVSILGLEVPGTEYLLYTEEEDVKKLADFVLTHIREMREYNFNLEMRGNFIVFYKIAYDFAENNYPAEILQQSLPLLEGLEYLIKNKL